MPVSRGPSVSPINSSIAFRPRPITIYLRGCGVTPPTDLEEEKKGGGEGNGVTRWKNGASGRGRGATLSSGIIGGAPGVRASV